MERMLAGCGLTLCAFGAEGTRMLIASALGGFTRWITTDRTHLRDAGLAIVGGALAGHYLWPMVLWVLGMDTDAQSTIMAAFIAGTLGISGVRLLAAVVEARTRRLQDA
ncbi:hypothetical protein [Falsirhodobacter sp. alg1]|uniref:hypothetical protein n=1 Tax=Falsirhodobacter sp. alg1 TaxID=1472418 RepID=UPI0005EFD03E|nr:hypothetical protein [Falsirhodobacter sp. alg1]